MKKVILIFLISVIAVFTSFATKVNIDQFDVGTFDAINNTYFLRNVEVFYDEETGLVGFSYYRGQLNDVRYTYNFVSQSEIDSVIANMSNALAIIRGERGVAEFIRSNELADPKSQNYEFSTKIDLERDEITEIGSVSSVIKTYSSFKLSFFLKEGSKNLCIGGDKVTFVPGNKKTSTEVFGFNETTLSRFISALKKENLEDIQRKYYEKINAQDYQ